METKNLFSNSTSNGAEETYYPKIQKKVVVAKQRKPSESYLKNREKLIALSVKMQSIRQKMADKGLFGVSGVRINDMIREYYRKNFKVTDLRTFAEWKSVGYYVKRGEEAYLLWAKPKEIKKTIKTEGEKKSEYENYQNDKTFVYEMFKYFPLCYLFDISQCEKI